MGVMVHICYLCEICRTSSVGIVAFVKQVFLIIMATMQGALQGMRLGRRQRVQGL